MSSETVTVMAWKLRRAAKTLEEDGDEHGIGADLRMMLADSLSPRQLVSVSSIDVEKLIAACVPGGDICDPQEVADNIRRYCNAWPTA